MIFDLRGFRKGVIIVIYLACSFLNPLFLINHYEQAKENIRYATKTNQLPGKIPIMIRKCREIKSQLVDFWKIELGRYISKVSNNIYIINNIHTFRPRGILSSISTNNTPSSHSYENSNNIWASDILPTELNSWNESITCSRFLYSLESQNLHQASFEDFQDRENLFWLHPEIFCWYVGFRCNMQKDIIHHLLLHTKFGIVQHFASLAS